MEQPKPLTAEFLATCLDHTESFVEALSADMDRWLDLPLPGSPAAIGTAAYPYGESLETVYGQVNVLMLSSADNLFGLLKLLREPAQGFAPWTVSRAIVEIAATALWLIELPFSPVRSLARSGCLRLADNSEQLAFAQTVTKEPSEIARIKARRAEIVATARARGLTPQASRKGVVVGFEGEQYPGATRVVMSTLGNEWFYRASSGIAHGFLWSALNTSLGKITGDPPRVEPQLLADHAWLVLTEAMTAFATLVDRRYQLYGWQRDEWLRSLESTWAALRLAPANRFWRTPASTL